MANQVTPESLLRIQLYDWKVLLAQLKANPDTPPADVAYCQTKIEQLQGEIETLTQ